MSFESVPCAETDISVEPLTPGYFLAFAARTIQDLNWTITFCDDHSLNATTASPDRPSCEEFIISVEGTTAHLRSQSFGNQLQQFDFGRNNENIREFLVRFEERDKALVPEQLAEEYEQLKTKLRPAEDDEDTEQEMQPEPVKASPFSYFLPVKGYFVTPIIININIAVFILMAVSGASILSPTVRDILAWGGDFAPYTFNGELWRLITCCFVHIGIIHLLFNMYALVYIGGLLEPLLGRNRYLLVFLLTGILSSISSAMVHPNIVSAGASGAIFGLFGAFIPILTSDYIRKSARRNLQLSIGMFVFYNLMNGFAKTGIDNAAHIGGLISGLVIGYVFKPSLVKQENAQ